MSKYHMSPNIYVNEIMLKVVDIKKSKEFYTNIMGFKILKEDEKRVVFSADGKNPIVTIVEPENPIPKPPRRTGLYHFAILLPSRKDLGLLLNHFKENNYPIVGGAYHGVSEAVYLQDVDNNGIEVYRDLDDSLWDRENGEIRMVTEPLNYKEIMELAEGEKWHGIPEGTIIGHIHLHVSDLDEAKRFYCDGLGFNLITSMGDSAIFLSSGGYHHHIGLNTWQGKGALPLPENSAGMKYFSLVFPNEEIRGEKIKNLRELGYEVIENAEGIFVKDSSENLIKLAV